MIEPLWLSARDLRRAYIARELSPVEVIERILAHVDALNPELAAFITVTSELALDAARSAETEYARGNGEERPLLGVPVSFKDSTPTRGVRTTQGSRLSRDWIPELSAPVVERLLAAGAVMIGKTNTPELGWKATTSGPVAAPARNPFSPDLTAGGSSGGAAVAVATGMGPAAQGGDGAGSIRIPAAFCGVFGFKPSLGRIPYHPTTPFERLVAVGPITRSVGDTALMLDVAAGADPRDRQSYLASVPDFASACERSVKGLRVAWVPELGSLGASAEVVEVCERAVDALRGCGCHVQEARLEVPDPLPILRPMWDAGYAAIHGDEIADVADQLDPGLLQVIERGNRTTGRELAIAWLESARLRDSIHRFMHSYDLILTPTTPIAAFGIDRDQPGEPVPHPEHVLAWTRFTHLFNLTGQPSASVPAGLTREGLPVGLQLVGRFPDDETVLAAAQALEDANPWQDSLREATHRLGSRLQAAEASADS